MASRLLFDAAMSRTLRCVLVSSFVISFAGAVRAADAQPAPIVGGSKVPAGRWDDVVAVIGATGRCSGTLIAPDVVLTAGHCIEIEPYEVITNTTDLAGPGGDHIAVKWARAYPDWPTRHDIGVLMLEHVARPRPRPIAAACHTNARLLAGAPLTIVGFGLVTPAGTDANTRLHEATVPVLDPLCAQDPGCEPAVRPNGEFTAGGRGSDSCFGDSGGPAFLDTAAGPALVGVVSRGLALPGLPCGNGGVYVRADKIVAWAQSVTERRFARTTCDGERDERADDPGTRDDDEGGCSVTHGGGPRGARRSGGPRPVTIGLGLVVAVAVLRRRRRSTAASDADAGLVHGLVPAATGLADPARSGVAAPSPSDLAGSGLDPSTQHPRVASPDAPGPCARDLGDGTHGDAHRTA